LAGGVMRRFQHACRFDARLAPRALKRVKMYETT
jgi:hypothetical protein